MLRVWGRKSSSNVQKAMWVVGELDLPHERMDAGGRFGGLQDESYLTLNPNGVIPTIEDEGSVIWESHAIVRYLAARYDPGGLWPEDPAKRALADQWMDWQHTTLYPQMGAVFWGLVRTAEKDRNKAAIELAIKRSGYYYEMLDEHLEGRSYIAGDHLTMGDIPIGTTLYRYFDMDIDRPEVPHVERWYARLREREAFREHVMVSYEELRVE